MPPDLRSKVTQKGTKIAHLGLGDKEKAESVNSIPSAFDFLRDKAGLEGRDTGKVLQALIHVGELPKETLRLVARDAIRAAAFLIISNVKKMEEEEAMEERIIGRIAAETAAPLEKLAASLKDTSDNLKEVRASVEALEKQQEKVVGASAPGNGTSYAAKAAAGIGRSQMVSGQQAQDLQRQRRIMVMWPEEDMGGKSTKSLTEKELVLKANMALKGYRRDVPKMPEGVRFVSAKKLPSGKGFQLNLATVEHADWLRKNDTLQGFLRHFDGGLCTSRPQTFGGVAEYVPISFSPDDRAALAEAAADSQMDSEDLVSARWIKPVQRRRPEQTTAFLIINFASPGAAQFAFAHGMIIEGKQVQVRELEPEPRRCLKCQKHEPGHMARDCPLKEDVCGTCGENHRTADCDVTEQEDFWCNNCQVRGHAAWDRQCPVFLLKKQQRTERLQSANQGIPIPRPNAAAGGSTGMKYRCPPISRTQT